MKKRILLAVFIITIVAINAFSQQNSYRPMMANWDLDSANDSACISTPIKPLGRIKTTGSSTTVDTLTANKLPFILASVGDIIYANTFTATGTTPGPKTGRVITAKASSDSITVDTAWDLGTVGEGFELWKITCADTTLSTGWTNIKANLSTQAYMSIDQMVVTSGGIRVKLEGAYGEITDSFLSVYNLWPGPVAASCGVGTWTAGYCVYTSATDAKAAVSLVNVNTTAVRWVFAFTGTDNDTTPSTDNEKITAGIMEIK